MTMRTVIAGALAGPVLAVTLATSSASSAELWGAYVEAGEYWGEGGEVYGLTWNYPSPEAAIVEATRLCRYEYWRCIEPGIHKYFVFSTSAGRINSHMAGDYSMAFFSTKYGTHEVFVWIDRCIAVEHSAGDYQASTGRSKQDAINNSYIHDNIETVQCNAQ